MITPRGNMVHSLSPKGENLVTITYAEYAELESGYIENVARSDSKVSFLVQTTVMGKTFGELADALSRLARLETLFADLSAAKDKP